MFKLNKLTDYAIVLLSHATRSGAVFSARELASVSGLPPATVSKVLHALSGAGILVSHRGPSGGYALARPAGEISIADVIATFEEGPIALTECSSAETSHQCEVQRGCPVRSHWQKINDAIRGALEGLSIEQLLVEPIAEAPLVTIPSRSRPIPGDETRT